jgi:hypothetical protein
MAAGPQLDGAGLAKMETLDEATAAMQRVHSIVERMAVAIRASQNTSQFGSQLRRTATPLVGKLKGQFGLIADQVSAMLLVASRSASADQVKLRSLREFVAQIKTQLEIAIAKTKEKHAIVEEDDEKNSGSS